MAQIFVGVVGVVVLAEKKVSVSFLQSLRPSLAKRKRKKKEARKKALNSLCASGPQVASTGKHIVRLRISQLFCTSFITTIRSAKI